MSLRFNMLLRECGLDPAEVRILRHQTQLPDGRIPLDLWQADPAIFDRYQSYQKYAQRMHFMRPWWASFVGTVDGRTLFLGLYQVGGPRLMEQETVLEDTGQTMAAATYEQYPLIRSDLLSAYSGKLYIDWAGGTAGKRAWSQRAEAQDKRITELHLAYAEPRFPGLMQLAMPLSALMSAPPSWTEYLRSGRGIYLLTCPDTGQLYVGSATGADGFWGRWVTYEANGHGGNIALIEGDKKDWTVSILQLAGSADSADDILASEALWKRKLMSRAFGLNRN